jgi:DNA primase large subunit
MMVDATAAVKQVCMMNVSLLCRHITEEGAAPALNAGNSTKVNLAQLPALAQKHFPLCMQQLYSGLMSERHLRHAGRMQLGLFLKKAGLTLEESMHFWKTSFAPRTSGEKFEKECDPKYGSHGTVVHQVVLCLTEC